MNERATIPATTFELNGQQVEAFVQVGERLSSVLREQLGARDVKVGCDAGDCGACTVLIDGAPVCACLTPAQQAQGRHVETAGGIVQSDPIADKLGQSFAAHGAAQCGICTPGMMASAVALLRETPKPTQAQVEDALGGVLCRCTGYRKIIDAVMFADGIARTGDGRVGQPLVHVDGARKIDGTQQYGDDIAPPGTLEILVIRSPFARAAFTFGDLNAFAEKTSGIEAILTAKDIPGRNAFGVIPQFVDQPVFAEHETRFKGEAVAAIVATRDVITNFDAADFPVTWQELPAVTTPEVSQKTTQNQLHDGHDANIMCKGLVACGDATEALETADFTVEGRYRSGFVEHAYIEPEAGFARMDGDRIELHACTQAPVMDRDALQIILGCDASQIRIIPTAVGGGFGAKLDITVQPFLALATLKTGKPVRMAYSRAESMQSSTKRHPSDITLKIGASKDGRLKGFTLDGVFDTGAYASWGPTVAVRVPVHASGPYHIPDYRAASTGVYTNNPPAGAFRGFGVPQAAIAQESAFDDLALKLGMDPLDFRILNALENGKRTVCGQVFEQGVGIKACFEALRPAWKAELAAATDHNLQNTTIRRGIGVAAGWYGCGNTSLPNPSTIKCGVRADGVIMLHQGAMDIGQGANTVIAQIFATALGVPVDALTLIGPDTDITPDGGKTSASRQTYVSGNAAKLSGEALRASILSRLNAAVDATLHFADGVITARDAAGAHELDLSALTADTDGYVLGAQETYDPPTQPLDENGQGAPYAQYGYAAHIAVIEVDTKLGTIRPIKFIAAHDVGKAINPMLVEGQVHGGIAQGLGMALMEEYIPGRTENLHDYLIPTIGDIPPIETLIIEEPDAHGPYGAKGLGEHALIPTAPALLNAIRHATGVRITQIPATPSRVYAALKEAQHG